MFKMRAVLSVIVILPTMYTAPKITWQWSTDSGAIGQNGRRVAHHVMAAVEDEPVCVTTHFLPAMVCHVTEITQKQKTAM